jgi:hypothetical protein
MISQDGKLRCFSSGMPQSQEIKSMLGGINFNIIEAPLVVY